MVQNANRPVRLSLLCLATFVLGEPPPPPPPSSKPPPLPPVSKLPPPPPPPPSLGAVEAVVAVELRLIASGSVSDYPDTSDLQQRIATAGGLWPSDVAISLMDSDGRPDYPNHGRCEARSLTLALTLTNPNPEQVGYAQGPVSTGGALSLPVFAPNPKPKPNPNPNPNPNQEMDEFVQYNAGLESRIK